MCHHLSMQRGSDCIARIGSDTFWSLATDSQLDLNLDFEWIVLLCFDLILSFQAMGCKFSVIVLQKDDPRPQPSLLLPQTTFLPLLNHFSTIYVRVLSYLDNWGKTLFKECKKLFVDITERYCQAFFFLQFSDHMNHIWHFFSLETKRQHLYMCFWNIPWVQWDATSFHLCIIAV